MMVMIQREGKHIDKINDDDILYEYFPEYSKFSHLN